MLIQQWNKKCHRRNSLDKFFNNHVKNCTNLLISNKWKYKTKSKQNKINTFSKWLAIWKVFQKFSYYCKNCTLLFLTSNNYFIEIQNDYLFGLLCFRNSLIAFYTVYKSQAGYPFIFFSKPTWSCRLSYISSLHNIQTYTQLYITYTLITSVKNKFINSDKVINKHLPIYLCIWNVCMYIYWRKFWVQMISQRLF